MRLIAANGCCGASGLREGGVRGARHPLVIEKPPGSGQEPVILVAGDEAVMHYG